MQQERSKGSPGVLKCLTPECRSLPPGKHTAAPSAHVHRGEMSRELIQHKPGYKQDFSKQITNYFHSPHLIWAHRETLLIQ